VDAEEAQSPVLRRPDLFDAAWSASSLPFLSLAVARLACLALAPSRVRMEVEEVGEAAASAWPGSFMRRSVPGLRSQAPQPATPDSRPS
jgi:hypothetical protein